MNGRTTSPKLHVWKMLILTKLEKHGAKNASRMKLEVCAKLLPTHAQ